MGFMPRAIRHVHPYWQLSSLGVISSYIWVLSLETASWGAHTLGTFKKHPLFSPPSTTSAIIRSYMVYICIYIYTVLGDPDLVSSSFHKVYILLTVVIMFIVVEVMANLYVLSMSGLNRLAIMSTFIHYIELHHLISLLYIS